MKSRGDVRTRTPDKGKTPPRVFVSPLLRRAGLLVFMGLGTLLSALALEDLLLGQASGREVLLLAMGGAAAWLPGMAFLPYILRGPYAAVPLLLPLAGSPLMFLAVIFFMVSRRKDYLADDPTIEMIFHPPKVQGRRQRFTLEDILTHDRKIVSAGDILRWGDVSLKQALIDRLASRQVTPRAIRILRGARNDPEDEVRLFATTILTRIEKKFQERTTALMENPDAVAPYAALGRSYLEYAESGLVGDRLAKSLFHSALAAYETSLAAGEGIDREELLHVAHVAVAQKNFAVFERARERVAADSDPLDLKRLEWARLYESGRHRELCDEIQSSRSLWEGKALPSYLSVWMEPGPSREAS